ncbi:MAG: hypothetical protein ABFR05_04385 [Bacteroidota bacterium]
MIIEKKILEYLNENDNGGFINISSVDIDYNLLKTSVEILRGRNQIVLDANKPRNFEAFGISNLKRKRINAKINSKGKEYLYCLRKSGESNCEETKKKKRFWKLAYFFG